MAITKGIDVSYAQGAINWSKTNNAIDFCIMRIGYGKVASQKDKQFEANYKGCTKPKGGYWYNYATTVADAKLEAEVCAKVLNGKKFDLPIFYDIEEQKTLRTGKTNVTNIAKAFINRMKELGYSNVGIYASGSPLMSYFDTSLKETVPVWVAWYDIKDVSKKYNGAFDIWQYTVGKAGTIAGISGAIDLDYCYVDLKPYKTNAKTTVATSSKTTVSASVKTEKTNTNTTNQNGIRKPDYAKSFENGLTGAYTVTAVNGLYCRYVPGNFSSSNVVEILPYGTKVQNYGYYTAINGVKWLYIKHGEKEGFSAITYLRKA